MLVSISTKQTVLAQKNKRASREQLEQQRQSILEEIKRTQVQLAALQKDKQASTMQFLALQSKLAARQELIGNINNEISILDQNISAVNQDVQKLRTELDTLKKQYAEMVRYTYKNRTSSDLIVFLFSAASFNDAVRRYSYVKQYRGFRADQAKKVTHASRRLSDKIHILNIEKQKKDFILQAQEQQSKILEAETAEKDKMLMMLKSQEKVLTAGLAKKTKDAENLNRAIATAIKREIEAAQKRAMAERQAQEKERKAKLALEQKTKLAKEKYEKQQAEKIKRESEARKLEEQKRIREENERNALAEKQKREEQERILALDRKQREEKQRILEEEKRTREENEKKAATMAESKRKERERQLAIEKKKQEERERQLENERKKQEEKQAQLLAQRQRAEEEQRRLTAEKKRQDREQARLNANTPFNNPRYVSALASSEKTNADVVSNVDPDREKTEEVKSTVKTFTKDDYKYSLTPSELQISTTLESNRGRLPWPVEKGFIAERFGKNKHPVFNIVTENYGIDIKTSRGSGARAVFPGEVSTVINIPGTGQTVIVNHGSYFTVYAKLSSVSVSKGTKVALKQRIGNVMTDDDGNTQIHFEIWKVGANGSPFKMNPEQWIAQ